MSRVKGKAGQFELEWERPPLGRNGVSHVRVNGGEPVPVEWSVDSNGIWIRLQDRSRGFDIRAGAGDTGRYQISRRFGFGSWQGASFHRVGEQVLADLQAALPRNLRIKADMPGKVLRLLVAEGDTVERDQPVLVMEAMKMENEIRAAAAGTVSSVEVRAGDAVEAGAPLLVIEGESK